jgi:transposase
MRFVAVKTPDQQGWLAVHRLRDGYIKDRTAWMNRTRSVLFEFGIMLPRASARFRDALQEAVSDRASGLPVNARPALRRRCAHLDELQQQVAWCDQQIEVPVEFRLPRGRLHAALACLAACSLIQFWRNRTGEW